MRSMRASSVALTLAAAFIAIGCGSDDPVTTCSGANCLDASNPDTGVDATKPPLDGSVVDASDASDGSADAGPPITRPSTLASGNLHNCAITSSKGVRCWGSNDVGQLGNGNTQPQTGAVDVLGIGGADPGAVSVALGSARSCALLTNGTVKCWGEGTGVTPATVPGIANATNLTLQWYHACVRLADTSVKCWGANGGRLANGTLPDSPTPVVVPNSIGTTAFAVGWGHTCLVSASGGVRCAGTYNNWGQVGDGTNATQISLVDALAGVEKPLTDIALIGMASYSTCAITTAGKLRCWGNNQGGSLATGTVDSAVHGYAGPEIAGLTDVIQVTGGPGMCALVKSGQVFCWGTNKSGDGTNQARTTPTAVSNMADAVEISANNEHTCARRIDGTIWCWGDNTYRQLGDGTVTSPRLAPVKVTVF